MRISNNRALCQRLAAEYALGTLRGAARRRFEVLLRDDANLRGIAAQWQEDLAALAEMIPEVRVPVRVWQAVTRRIPALEGRAGASHGWFASLALWRSTTVAALAGALFVIGTARFGGGPMVTPGVAPSGPAQAGAPRLDYVAAFTDPKTGRAVALLYASANSPEVSLKILDSALVIGSNQTLELWTAASAGKSMVPAGLVPAGTADAVLRFPVPDAAVLRDAPLLGLSLEPAGGSPAPTQVLGVARWVRVEA